MRSITAPQPGGPHALKLSDSPVPSAQPGEVVVKVEAAGVNRADVLQRMGFYTPPAGATNILGLEAAGTVHQVGDGVEEWQVGDRVAVLLTGGGYAEYVPVPAGQVLPVPEGMSFVEAAALPEVVATVYSNVVMAAGLSEGDWLLVHGGASGIGTMAIQIAKHVGARVAVTVGGDDRARKCADLGADAVINYREEDFVERIREITGGGAGVDGSSSAARVPGADVILDIIGAKYLERNIQALSTDGRLVIIGMQGGTKAQINLGDLLPLRRSVMGTTLRARPDEQKAHIVSEVRKNVWPAVASGKIRPIVDSVFALEDCVQAHEHMDQPHFGKIVLEVNP